MQVNLYELKTNLVFLASSGPAQAGEILFETLGGKKKGKGGGGRGMETHRPSLEGYSYKLRKAKMRELPEAGKN